MPTASYPHDKTEALRGELLTAVKVKYMGTRCGEETFKCAPVSEISWMMQVMERFPRDGWMVPVLCILLR